ncbi:MAG: type I glutamate--ammonia ligase, partial [Acidimicrobiales bacterium]
SGLHVNLSFTGPPRWNAVNDPDDPDGISLLARQAVAGLLAHHRGLAGLCAPTVNAYRRLRPGQLAGYWASWGLDHRGATVRIPQERGSGARLEHRLSDGAAPVHTAVAAVLQAARLGVVDKLDLGPAETGDGFDNVDATVAAPASLGEALDALEADGALCDAVGEQLVRQHLAVKRTEWDRYCATTTDWELREYLPFL